MNISEILKAQACDNLPRLEVRHDNATASTDQAVESVSGSGTTGADAAECGAGDSRFGVCAVCDAPIETERGDPLAVWRMCSKCDED